MPNDEGSLNDNIRTSSLFAIWTSGFVLLSSFVIPNQSFPMTLRTLIHRSLRFHWRLHLGVVLGAAIGSAALIGALVVGDSVKHTLQYQAVRRLPGVSVALDSNDRFFSRDLMQRMIKLGQEQVPLASAQEGQLTWGNGFTPYESTTGLRLDASVTRADATAQLHRINLFGYGDDVLEQIRSGQRPYAPPPPFPGDGVWLNHALAQRLQAKAGDELIFRIPKPAALSGEAAISPRNDATVALRLRVIGVSTERVAPDSHWREWFIKTVAIGAPPTDLDLHPSFGPALNAFVAIDTLSAAADIFDNRCNLILAGPASQLRTPDILDRYRSAAVTAHNQQSLKPILRLDWLKPVKRKSGFYVDSQQTLKTVTPLFNSAFSLNDAQLTLTSYPHRQTVELRSDRIFLEPPVVRAALAADSNAQPILTYLVNLLRAGTNATPYSMITAADAPWTPADMRDDELLVSQWLADDLRVKPGDEVALVYFDPESGARLTELTNTFRVRGIVPMELPWADRTLMPDFPGIEKAESTSEWDAGFRLTYKVRPKDDEYWKEHRGTPKAFVTLAAGNKMWGNRFGNLTAIRYPIPSGSSGHESAPFERGTLESQSRLTPAATIEGYCAALEKKILANLKPEELGLRFEPVRAQALKAAEGSQDFGGLFLGFSFFLILAALLLMALLFRFGLEQRAPEIGTLLALGFTPKQVRKLLLREGVALAFLGGIIGTLGGIWYAKAMLHGLNTIWRDAVGAASLNFHATAQTIVIGLFASVVVSAITIWLTLRKFVRRPARELLVGEIGMDASKVQSLRAKVIGLTALLAGIALVGWAIATGDAANAGIFFGAGALMLVAGLNFVSAWLGGLDGAPVSDPAGATTNQKRAGSETGAPITAAALALRGCARRRKRSLATVAMLACGSFLIVSIGVFRLDANRDAWQKSSGTGGFALIGESTLPVVQDLNSRSGRDFFALNDRDLEGVNFVSFRVREGDEASCLNLNAAQTPRLLGVKPELMEGRFGFAKGVEWRGLRGVAQASRLPPSENRKDKLETGATPVLRDEIPAIGDANSIQWAMHKNVGDTIDYVDERGQPFKVRIVGAVANSILQGQLIIDEAEFVRRFPGESGYRMFLIDAPSNAVSQVSATLSRALQDVGLELTPAAERLAQFNAVQNTYLGTFQVLGGLGLLLGSVGLGIVVLRNVLERRGELALLMAVGFRKPQVQRLLLTENAALLATGLALGVVAAAVAVLPALLSPGSQLPVASLALTLVAVLLNGAAWTWAATRLALRGDLLSALRSE